MRCSRWIAAQVPAALVLLAAFVPLAHAQPAKLLISQVEVRGGQPSTNLGEYVVIRNPGSSAVDLSNYYLTDATRPSTNQYYYNLPDESLPIGGGSSNDFVARFPAGAMLGAGQEISIAVDGSQGFEEKYGNSPNYEMYEDGASPDAVPDMREARPGSVLDNVAQPPTLSNAGEVVILFYWDGSSNLVTDIDYLVWGDKEEAVDKTGVTITKTGNSTGSTYLADTPIANQDAQTIGTGTGPSGTYIRTNFNEGSQKTSGGNGVGGRDETSENLTATFSNDTSGIPPGMTQVDVTPPTLVSALGSAGNSHVDVVFSEAVGTGASTAANYHVYPTGNPAGGIGVTAAEIGGNGTTVSLQLASALAAGTGYTVEVSNVKDLAGNTITAASKAQFTTGGSSTFSVLGAFQFGPRQIGVAYSQAVNAGSAITAGNYTLTSTPAVTVSGAVLQENGQTVILTTAADLPKSTAIGVSVQNVTGTDGGALVGKTANLTTASETITGIQAIHSNITAMTGQTVTIIGQVYIPATAQGANISGWIQDGTGKGLNLFATGTTTTPPAVAAYTQVAKCTGTISVFSNSVYELLNFTAVSVASNMPRLKPKVLTVEQTASREWESTYIQTTSTITVAPAASGASNFNVACQGLVFRVRNDTGIDLSKFNVGDTVTGAGSGADFQGTAEINVGNADEFVKGGGGPDTTPPTLVSASGQNTSITVNFSETVATGASTASNYKVYPTASPSSTVSVTGASASGATVTLTLGSALSAATGYTVEVSNVQDAAGNTIAAASKVNFTTSGSSADLTLVGAFQFGPNEVGVAFNKTVNPAQAVAVANYAFSPALTVASATLQENGQTVVLHASAALPKSTPYTVTVTGVTAADGGALVGSNNKSFTTAAETITGIQTIHDNIGTMQGQTVTIIGQPYIPVAAQTTTVSGWIQDGTGKGLNLFAPGTTVSPAVSSYNQISKVTGVVTLFSGSVYELATFTATQVATGMPRLKPKVLTVAQAASREWESTYIQTTSTITKAPAASGSSNYNVEAGAVVFRVRNSSGIDLSQFHVGDMVTAAGAGADFQGAAEINVGNVDEFYKGGGGPDTTPPTLVSASGANSSITVNFSEAVGTGASTASNYQVFRTGDTGSTVAVTGAAPAGSSVTLTLGAALSGGVGYTVRVSNVQDTAGNVIAPNSQVAFTAGGQPATLTMTGVFQFGAKHVGIGFTKTLSPATATTLSNYSFSPPLSLASAEIQDNGLTVILHASSDLPRSTAYTLTVSGVTAGDGTALTGNTSGTFTTASEQVLDIATIQADTSAYSTKTVTVIGQVYIPTGSRGGTPNGYIQDGSGRGLNLFGTGATTATNTLGSVVKVTGMVTIFFTTVEVERYTATQLATGQPKLAAKVLTIAQANSPAWEGTYIETTGILSSIVPTGTSGAAWNINAREETGSREVTFRLTGTGLGIDPNTYSVGERVTGRGAGGAFQSTFQILLGNTADFFRDSGGPDDTPPKLTGASGQGKTVQVLFSESVGAGASTASNYQVFETANPGNTNRVLAAQGSGGAVALTMEDAVTAGVNYTVEVSNVQDLAGNTILTGSRVSFTGSEDVARITVPARTFMPTYDVRFPVVISGPPGGYGVLRIFDLQGRLVKVLFETTVNNQTTFSGREEVEWDGRDEEFERVPAGMYIAHFELQSGNHRSTDKAPIVVATRLD